LRNDERSRSRGHLVIERSRNADYALQGGVLFTKWKNWELFIRHCEEWNDKAIQINWKL